MKRETFYIGIDESNHGRFPEVFAAVFSTNSYDIKENVKKFPKKKPKDFTFSELEERLHSFVNLNESTKFSIPKENFYGIIFSSLMRNMVDWENKKLEIHYDGEKMRKKDMVVSKRMIKDFYQLPIKHIGIYTGKNLDENNYLVNLADSLARHYFRNPEKAEKDTNRKDIITY